MTQNVNQEKSFC
jgi:hypothetical protein